jgi:cardiolipin synthase (CMP-forming)
VPGGAVLLAAPLLAAGLLLAGLLAAGLEPDAVGCVVLAHALTASNTASSRAGSNRMRTPPSLRPMGEGGDRIWTIPNAISVARLIGVPVFLWLVLRVRTPVGDWWAVGLLMVSGASDWLDGKIARALNQQSRLGQMLDPAADRLYIVATIVALAVRSIIPWWLVALLAVRELLLGVVLAVLRRRGWGALQVSFVGKTATLCLLYAFPLLFLGSHVAGYAETARVAGWTFAIWGSALYWCAALLYIVQARRLLAGPAPREAYQA